MLSAKRSDGGRQGAHRNVNASGANDQYRSLSQNPRQSRTGQDVQKIGEGGKFGRLGDAHDGAQDQNCGGQTPLRAAHCVGQPEGWGSICSLPPGLRAGHCGRGDGLLVEVGAFEVGRQPSFAEGDDAVTDSHDFRKLGADEQDGGSLLGQIEDELMDLCLGSHVYPAGRFVQDKDPGCGGLPATEDHLLLVTPAQGAHGLFDRVGPDRHLADDISRQLSLCRRAYPAPGTEAAQHRDGGVGAQRVVQE